VTEGAGSHGTMGHDGNLFYLSHVAGQTVFCRLGGFVFGAGTEAWRGGHEFATQKIDCDDAYNGHDSEKISLSGTLLLFCHDDLKFDMCDNVYFNECTFG